MTAPLPVSVIVVSRHRPVQLRRCLLGLMQLDYPAFEVIVVADPSGIAVACDFPVRAIPFDEPNISAARNTGIRAAAGEIVAFTDDDAVPEPLWLHHLAAPFERADVTAAGGFVVGANGISRQWTSGTVDRLLNTGPLPVPLDQPSLHRASPGMAVEIKGVNCAYRRARLLETGGFDPDLRYYLDETEMNLRLAAAGALVAVVPEARVHHCKAASNLRTADHTPRDLTPVGVSAAVTLRRHGATPDELRAAADVLFAAERAKLLRLVAGRKVPPAEAERLIDTLRSGFVEGTTRNLPSLRPLVEQAAAFQPIASRSRTTAILAGRFWQRARLKREAARRVATGEVVRLFLFSPTTLFHRLSFTDGGYWMQTGGLFGKSDRGDPWVRFWRFSARLRRESARFSTGFRNS